MTELFWDRLMGSCDKHYSPHILTMLVVVQSSSTLFVADDVHHFNQ
jgi:hypothetical protein